MVQPTQRICIYCGEPALKVKRGEHIIPEAIGGSKKMTIKSVCATCNNETLSGLDTELCSRSPLAQVAGLEKDRPFPQTWDVDESDDNLLLEARHDRDGSDSRYVIPYVFPQLIIRPTGIQFRADYDHLMEYGEDRFYRDFVARLQTALKRYQQGDKKAFRGATEKPNAEMLKQYTYPPRFFVRGSIAEACDTEKNKTIFLGYLENADRELALAELPNALTDGPLTETRMATGSAAPPARTNYDGSKVWRALTKIAFNMLHHYCKRTTVDREHFPRAVAEILGERPLASDILRYSGFVWAHDVASLNAPPNTHACRFHHDGRLWHAVFSFYGGQIGAVTSFEGPCYETWKMLDVQAPVGSADWTTTERQYVIVLHFNYADSEGHLRNMISGIEFAEGADEGE
jgi:hypothetical protein